MPSPTRTTIAVPIKPRQPRAAKAKRLNVKALSLSIAKELFTNFNGDVVGQLRLMHSTAPDSCSYGGWCLGAVRDRIEEQLRRALREVNP